MLHWASKLELWLLTLTLLSVFNTTHAIAGQVTLLVGECRLGYMIVVNPPLLYHSAVKMLPIHPLSLIHI